MTKREGPRRSKRLANHAPSASNLDHPRRCKGRARTRASGVKVLMDPLQDEKRLKDQLNQMGFYAVDTLGDGNCLFRALSDQLYGTPNRHLEIRHQVCNYLAQNESRYKAFVDTDEDQSWESHLEQMSKQGTYGGHLELSAFANFHRKSIKIIQPGMVYVISYEDESPGSINNQRMKLRTKGKGKKSDNPSISADTTLYLVYHQWEHYSSVRNLDGPHSGIPHIREPDLESSVAQNLQIDNDEQGKEETNSSSDSIKPMTRNRSLSKRMSNYRESISSPDSVGSTTTTMSSTISTSSPSSIPLTENTNRTSLSNQVESEQDLTLRNQQVIINNNNNEANGDTSISSSTYNTKTVSKTKRQLRSFNSYNTNNDDFKNSSSYIVDNNNKNLNNHLHKPLSKKEKRLLRRNKTFIHIHNNHNHQPQQLELRSDASVLFKELKV